MRNCEDVMIGVVVGVNRVGFRDKKGDVGVSQPGHLVTCVWIFVVSAAVSDILAETNLYYRTLIGNNFYVRVCLIYLVQ